MLPFSRPLLASAIAAFAAGCVSQGGGVPVQQSALTETPGPTSKVDAEVQRIFAVAGLDPNDPQKSRSVDRQSMGQVLAIRSGGRKVGMAVAHVGRDQIKLQDPEAVARVVPGADAESLSKALAGRIPTSGSVPGARFAFDRKHLALEIEADRAAPTSITSALMASKFVRSDKVGEPIPDEVVASIRSGGRGERDAVPAQDLAAGLPAPTAPAQAQQPPGVFASLFGGAKTPSTAQVAAAPPAPPAIPLSAGIMTPPAPSTYEAGPPMVTVADESYGSDRPSRRTTSEALGYAAQAADPFEPPAKPSVKRW